MNDSAKQLAYPLQCTSTGKAGLHSDGAMTYLLLALTLNETDVTETLATRREALPADESFEPQNDIKEVLNVTKASIPLVTHDARLTCNKASPLPS